MSSLPKAADEPLCPTGGILAFPAKGGFSCPSLLKLEGVPFLLLESPYIPGAA